MRTLISSPDPDRPNTDPVKNPDPPQPETIPGNPSQYPTRPNEIPAREPAEIPDYKRDLSASSRRYFYTGLRHSDVPFYLQSCTDGFQGGLVAYPPASAHPVQLPALR